MFWSGSKCSWFNFKKKPLAIRNDRDEKDDFLLWLVIVSPRISLAWEQLGNYLCMIIAELLNKSVLQKEKKEKRTPLPGIIIIIIISSSSSKSSLPTKTKGSKSLLANLITEHLDIAVGCWASLTAQNVPSDVGFVGSKRLAHSQGGGVTGVWLIATSKTWC